MAFLGLLLQCSLLLPKIIVQGYAQVQGFSDPTSSSGMQTFVEITISTQEGKQDSYHNQIELGSENTTHIQFVHSPALRGPMTAVFTSSSSHSMYSLHMANTNTVANSPTFGMSNTIFTQNPPPLFQLSKAHIRLLPAQTNPCIPGDKPVDWMKQPELSNFVWLIKENSPLASDLCISKLLNLTQATMVIVVAVEPKVHTVSRFLKPMVCIEREYKKLSVYLSDERTLDNLHRCMEYQEAALKGLHEKLSIFNGTVVSCTLSVLVSNRDESRQASKTSVLFVSISFILLLVLSLAWLVFYYVQRFRQIHTKKQVSRRLATLAKKAMARIPVKTLKSGDQELNAEQFQCAICIDAFLVGDVVRVMPCRHVFHRACLDPWLLEMRSCPMCKLDILTTFGLRISCSEGEDVENAVLLQDLLSYQTQQRHRRRTEQSPNQLTSAMSVPAVRVIGDGGPLSGRNSYPRAVLSLTLHPTRVHDHLLSTHAVFGRSPRIRHPQRQEHFEVLPGVRKDWVSCPQMPIPPQNL